MTANNTQAHEPLQRILLPKRGEPFDVRMLYLIEAEQNRERLSWFDRTSVTIPAGEEASFETTSMPSRLLIGAAGRSCAPLFSA